MIPNRFHKIPKNNPKIFKRTCLSFQTPVCWTYWVLLRFNEMSIAMTYDPAAIKTDKDVWKSFGEKRKRKRNGILNCYIKKYF